MPVCLRQGEDRATRLAQEVHQGIWVQMAIQEYYMFPIPMSDQSHLHSSNSLTFQGMHIGGMEILVL